MYLYYPHENFTYLYDLSMQFLTAELKQQDVHTLSLNNELHIDSTSLWTVYT